MLEWGGRMIDQDNCFGGDAAMSVTRSFKAPLGSRPDQRTMAFEAVPMLVVTTAGELHGRSVSLRSDELRIGRGAGNDLQLDDPFLSRTHAVLRHADGQFVIEDLGSGSGVVINDDLAIGPTAVRYGDCVRLGQLELELGWGPV
jgi:hypothetical protein